jgi:hypothetical protein
MTLKEMLIQLIQVSTATDQCDQKKGISDSKI